MTEQAEQGVGIDTLIAVADGITIDLGHDRLPPLTSPPANVVTGEVVGGTEFATADGGSVTLKRGRIRTGRGSALESSVVKDGLKATLSLARRPSDPAKAPNVRPIFGCDDLWRRIQAAERRYRERGFVIDLGQAIIVRVDLFKDVPLPLAVHEYAGAFDQMGLRPMTPTDEKELFGRAGRRATSYASYNTDRGLVVYDKPEQLGLLEAPPVARVEDRFRTERAVESQLGITRVADLVDHWETVRRAFVGTVEECFGRPLQGAAPDLGSVRMSNRQLLQALKARRSRPGDALGDYLIARGIEAEASGPGGMGAFHELVEKEGYDPRQVRRKVGGLVDFVRTEEGPTCGELRASLAAAIAGPAYGWPEFAEHGGGRR